jgi:hypothetical protein
MPWPLTREECEKFCGAAGLRIESLEDFIDPYEAGVRRFRIVYREYNREEAPRRVWDDGTMRGRSGEL